MDENEIAKVEEVACGEEWCHVCRRATDHWGEHSEAQIVAWSKTPIGVALLR